MWIDTHAHLYSDHFNEDRNEVIQNAVQIGIKQLLLPNIDVESITPLLAVVEKYPSLCFPMMGLHPCSVNEQFEENLVKIKNELFSKKYIAVGEIGIDLYWSKEFVNEQLLVFETQIKWALELDLPIVIHARDSFKEIYEVLDKFKNTDLRGVFHCFTGKSNDVKKIKSYQNFLFGIGGVLTYKNTKLRETLLDIKLENIVLETDSPYLPPVPYRGKRNEPKYMLEVAQVISDVFQLEMKKIAEISTSNAKKCFTLLP
ncbi:MAG: TatD family hydrolase [Flavobacteriia bacterium]|nr:TatD family hydrolase [Flavobacteriia bacterium]